MSEETKTYLVDVKSNLDEYMQEVIRCREEVARLTIEQLKLKANVATTDEELEKVNSELRIAQKELTNARKNMDTFTTANKAAKGSYQELYNLWKLSSVQLKNLEGTLKRNADGTYVLTDAYIKAKKENHNYKLALDSFGKGINDNRLNVGNYTESIREALGGLSMMPGALGRAGGAVEMFGSMIKRVMGAGGLGAIILGLGAAIGALTSPFVAFFKNSEKGAELLERKVSAVKASFDVLRGKLIEVGDVWTEKISGSGKGLGEMLGTAKEAEGTLANKMYKIFVLPFQAMGAAIKVTMPGLVDLVNEMNDAAVIGETLTGRMQNLKEEEIAIIPARAKASLQLREARQALYDVNKTTEERIEGLEKALAAEDAVAAKELANAEENFQITKLNYERMDRARQNDDEQKKILAEAEARRDNVKAESVGRTMRAERALKAERQNMAEEIYKLIAAEVKLDQIRGAANIDNLKYAKEVEKTIFDQIMLDEELNYEQREKLREDFDATMRSYDDKIVNEQIYQAGEKKRLALLEVDSKILQDAEISAQERLAIEAQYQADIEKLINDSVSGKIVADFNAAKRRKDAAIARQKAGIDADKIENENAIQNRREFLDKQEEILIRERDIEMASTEFKAKSKEEQRKIEANYTKAFIALSRARVDFAIQELNSLGQAFGDLAGQFAKHTAAYKVFSVAQATIAVITAALQAMNDWQNFTVIQKIAAAGSILAYGFALINTLKAVTTSGSNSAPQTINGSTNTRRALAPTVGATILTQPQLSQAQAASLPNANMLTAEDIMNAIKSMPAPIVTVEDINVRAKSKTKIEVRANI